MECTQRSNTTMKRSNTSRISSKYNLHTLNSDADVEKEDEQFKLSNKINATPIHMREPIDSYTERIDVQMDGSLRRSNTSKNKRIDNPSSANLDTVVEKKDE